MIIVETYTDPDGIYTYKHYTLTADSDRFEWGGRYMSFGKGEVFTEESPGGWYWHEYDLGAPEARDKRDLWQQNLVREKGWQVDRQQL